MCLNAGMANDEVLTGACMCEAIRFSVSAPLIAAAYCHCKRCQRRTGSTYSVSALQPGSFSITKGEDQLGTYRPPDDGWLKAFCRQCGSQLFTSHPENPELIAIRVGAVDQDDPGVRPSVHQFVSSAAMWDPIPDDGLPRFAERLTSE